MPSVAQAGEIRLLAQGPCRRGGKEGQAIECLILATTHFGQGLLNELVAIPAVVTGDSRPVQLDRTPPGQRWLRVVARGVGAFSHLGSQMGYWRRLVLSCVTARNSRVGRTGDHHSRDCGNVYIG